MKKLQDILIYFFIYCLTGIAYYGIFDILCSLHMVNEIIINSILVILFITINGIMNLIIRRKIFLLPVNTQLFKNFLMLVSGYIISLFGFLVCIFLSYWIVLSQIG